MCACFGGQLLGVGSLLPGDPELELRFSDFHGKHCTCFVILLTLSFIFFKEMFLLAYIHYTEKWVSCFSSYGVPIIPSCSSLTLANNPYSLLSTLMFLLLLPSEDHQDCLQELIYSSSDYTSEENTLPSINC